TLRVNNLLSNSRMGESCCSALGVKSCQSAPGSINIANETKRRDLFVASFMAQQPYWLYCDKPW
ncbi:hypothetical protein AVEN_44234-1, partial [Araneus ventricosus]